MSTSLRRAMTVTLPAVISVAGAVLGHPPGPVAPTGGAAGTARRRCSRACGGRCRSAVRARPVLL